VERIVYLLLRRILTFGLAEATKFL
jgi:hypothetical protein